MPNEPHIVFQPPRSGRPLHRVLAILLLVLLSPVIAWFAWARLEAARLDRVLDALEASGVPLDIVDFDVKPTTKEQREASHLYRQAANLVGDDIRAPLAGVVNAVEELCALLPASANRTEQIRTLQSFEDRYKAALALLDRAGQLDAGGWDDADRPKRLSMEEMRPVNLVTVNAVRIARLACSGNGDAAAAALVSTLRMGRVRSASSVYAARLPAQTAHSLQSLLTFGSPNPDLLQKIQQEYEAAADEHAGHKQMLYSRASWFYYSMPGVFSDAPPGYEGRRITPLEGIARMVTRPLRDQRARAEIREFDDAIHAARQPWPARLDAAAALARKYPVMPSRRVGLVEVLTRPSGLHSATASLSTGVARDAEALARARASVATVAVARFRRAHQGTLPAALQDLIPEYLPALLNDPYSGKEMKYVHHGTSYKVYSVGINRQDDGGKWDQNSDLQWSRRGNPPDIGISVGARPAGGR